MFRVEWIERHLSRVRPGQVVTVWLPVFLCFLWLSVHRRGDGLLGTLPYVAAGVLGWTLLEYVLHRFAFHYTPDPASELQRDLYYLVHGVHHDWPYDPDRLVMPPAVAVVLAFVVGIPLRAAVGYLAFPGVFAGVVGGYLWYDLTHYAVHHGWRPRTAFGRLQRRNHLVHHFGKDPGRYGVTTPLWDLVFGTYPRLKKSAEPQTAAP